MNNHPATFSIHLLEDAEGNVRVVSDWSGEGESCLSLGIEIMQSLKSRGRVSVKEVAFNGFTTGKTKKRQHTERLFICKVKG